MTRKRPRPTCQTCRFFSPDPEEADVFGECRIRAPIPAPRFDEKGLWPVVGALAWCGEHEPPVERPLF
jgi:hypothetical protein